MKEESLNIIPQILVVDDDPMFLSIVENILTSRLGYAVTVVDNAREALITASEKVFNLIISDIQMPKMNGNELVRQMRNMPEYKLTPFILLSSNNENDNWIRGLDDGADDFLSKPFDPSVFIAKVNANLKRFSLQKEAISLKKNKQTSIENGKVVYCTNETYKFTMPTNLIECESVAIFDEETLFSYLQENDVWLLLINEHANWVEERLDKILSIAKEMNLQVTVLVNSYDDEAKIESYFKKGCDDIIIKKKSFKIIAQEINARLHREISYKSKYLNALTLAANSSPIRLENSFETRFNGFSISCCHESYEGLPGGDFYEVFTLNENESLVAFGDVMGKKWGAWFFVLAYIAYIRSTLKILSNNVKMNKVASQPEEVLRVLNEHIYKDLQLSEVFTTLSLIYVNAKTATVKIASAGSLEPLHFHKTTKDVSIIPTKGMLLGLMEDSIYEVKEIKLKEGDRIAFYTDGYSEVKKPNSEEMVGDDAVIEMLETNSIKKYEEASAMDTYFLNKQQIEKFDDDRTLLIITNTNK